VRFPCKKRRKRGCCCCSRDNWGRFIRRNVRWLGIKFGSHSQICSIGPQRGEPGTCFVVFFRIFLSSSYDFISFSLAPIFFASATILPQILRNLTLIPYHIQSIIDYRSKLWPHINYEPVREKFLNCTKLIDYKITKFFKNRENAKFWKIKDKFSYIGSFLKSKNTPTPVLNIEIIS
jgi:hypothetical protein